MKRLRRVAVAPLSSVLLTSDSVRETYFWQAVDGRRDVLVQEPETPDVLP